MNILHLNLSNVILTAKVNIDTVIKVPQAFLNTVFYMGIIFIILILLSLLVLLIKLIFHNSNGKNSDNGPITNTGNLLSNQTGRSGDIDLGGNTELVAVITAAIMASMGEDAPEDGLVVRSIRRTGTK
jgi:glutaconyl-CoA/methylmalonyl-CoA decarboxylase subunit delta